MALAVPRLSVGYGVEGTAFAKVVEGELTVSEKTLVDYVTDLSREVEEVSMRCRRRV